MKLRAGVAFKRLGRVLSLIVLAALGTIGLMRFAPGYFSNARELDAQYAEGARTQLAEEKVEQTSILKLAGGLVHGWMHGDLGRSRQYDLPVTELLKDRLRISARLLATGVGLGWLLAISLALPLSARRSGNGEAFIAAPAALLLAIPIGALATACLLANFGGPVLVLTLLIGVRDFKLVYRLLRQSWQSPHLFYARAQGISPLRVVRIHLLPRLVLELFALAMTSFVLALSAIVPVEVIFDVPGLGQLAWSAAMNRDLPVLLAVTLLMAAAVGIAGMLSEPAAHEQIFTATREAELCA